MDRRVEMALIRIAVVVVAAVLSLGSAAQQQQPVVFRTYPSAPPMQPQPQQDDRRALIRAGAIGLQGLGNGYSAAGDALRGGGVQGRQYCTESFGFPKHSHCTPMLYDCMRMRDAATRAGASMTICQMR
jgi:hypothetical protein